MTELEDLRRRLRISTVTSLSLSLIVGGLATVGFSTSRETERFKEIDVERINVVEPDGKLRLVISNRPRSVGPIYKGHPFARHGGDRPGFIFFNDEGTENGGLTFAGSSDSLGHVSAGTHMSFDQFNEDQVLNLDYAEHNGRRVVGMTIDDRADIDIRDLSDQVDSARQIGDTALRARALARLTAPRNGVPLKAERLFIGRDQTKSALLSLRDPQGRMRLRILVDSLGAARIEFLDESGSVVRSFAQNP